MTTTNPVSASPIASFEAALTGAVSSASPSIVRVDRRRGGGSGLVWAPDLVVTASFHAPDKTTVGIAGADGSITERDATIVGRDPGTDVAVLRVDGGGLTPAQFRDLDGVAVGQPVLALGRPGRSVRASLRIIGVLGPEMRTPGGGRLERYVETDRQIPRGFAGGPLVSLDGRVLGMSTRTLLRGADLAIPRVTLERVVGEILAHGGVRRGYLGVGAYPVALPTAIASAVGRDRGALVASVEDGGPAATAGILVGDILLAIAGDPIEGPEDLRESLADRADTEVELDLVRAGARQTIKVKIGVRS
ncbi:MAG TPA: trypsin-like peptidase domain-containing protein [Kofleriaceae bacterium]|nr:trypsin-like peptidase domain-containing protein [Kofleriaceae bacterium]